MVLLEFIKLQEIAENSHFFGKNAEKRAFFVFFRQNSVELCERSHSELTYTQALILLHEIRPWVLYLWYSARRPALAFGPPTGVLKGNYEVIHLAGRCIYTHMICA